MNQNITKVLQEILQTYKGKEGIIKIVFFDGEEAKAKISSISIDDNEIVYEMVSSNRVREDDGKKKLMVAELKDIKSVTVVE